MRGIPCFESAALSLTQIDCIVKSCGFHGAIQPEAYNKDVHSPTYMADYVRDGQEVRVTYLEGLAMHNASASVIVSILDLKELKRRERRKDWPRENVTEEGVSAFIISSLLILA